MDWHWAWFWWTTIKHMYMALGSLVLSAFSALFWTVIEFAKLKWVVAVFTDPYAILVAPFDGVWAQPGAGLKDIDNFVQGYLYCRALLGALWATSRWCHHQVCNMTAKAHGSIALKHLGEFDEE